MNIFLNYTCPCELFAYRAIVSTKVNEWSHRAYIACEAHARTTSRWWTEAISCRSVCIKKVTGARLLSGIWKSSLKTEQCRPSSLCSWKAGQLSLSANIFSDPEFNLKSLIDSPPSPLPKSYLTSKPWNSCRSLISELSHQLCLRQRWSSKGHNEVVQYRTRLELRYENSLSSPIIIIAPNNPKIRCKFISQPSARLPASSRLPWGPNRQPFATIHT